MAFPFCLPESGSDDTASSLPQTAASSSTSSSSASSGVSSASSTSSSSASSSDGASSVASQSPNTTTSATQTPMQSPLVPGEQLIMAIYEAFQRYSIHTATPIFQYPPPPSPSCSLHSPCYNGGEVFFPRGRSTPRTPRTSFSYAAGEEANFFRQHPTTPQPMPPQSAPPMHHNYQPQTPHYHHPTGTHYATHYAQYTPPPTPTTNTAPSGSNAQVYSSSPSSSSSSAAVASTSACGTGGAGGYCGASSSSSLPPTAMRLHRSHSDAARRSRLTSTGEDEREYPSDHDETSWDEFDDRYENFTAGRERLQEFNGRIPPRKKNKNKEPEPKEKPEKKEQSFTWPTVVTVFVVAMGCGFLVAR